MPLKWDNLWSEWLQGLYIRHSYAKFEIESHQQDEICLSLRCVTQRTQTLGSTLISGNHTTVIPVRRDKGTSAGP